MTQALHDELMGLVDRLVYLNAAFIQHEGPINDARAALSRRLNEVLCAPKEAGAVLSDERIDKLWDFAVRDELRKGDYSNWRIRRAFARAVLSASGVGGNVPAPVEKFRCSAHQYHMPDCRHCVAQNTEENAAGVNVPAPDQPEGGA